ncbi:MAG: GNAT family N-acetyltransferase [Alphaproteobacteria bacterium]|jgi:RimJ/RimL family protein N-acetyltransferase
MSDRIIKTRRLRLEPLAPCHGPALESFARLWDVARYTATIPHPYPPGSGTAYAENVAFDRRHGGELIWAVMDRKTYQMVGSAGLDPSLDRRRFELGYMFAPWSWGRGVASEAALALIDTAFNALDADEVFAHAVGENRASCRVLTNAGLRRIGIGTYYAPARDHWTRAEAYRLLRGEWSS